MTQIVDLSDLSRALVASGAAMTQSRQNEAVNRLTTAMAVATSALQAGTAISQADIDTIVEILRDHGATVDNIGPSVGAGGPPQPLTATLAVQHLLTDPSVSPGKKAALRRLLNPNDPEQIEVDPTGTPTEVLRLQRELVAVTDHRNQVRAQLDIERDPAVPTSLAGRLRAAQNATMVGKVEVKTILDRMTDAWNRRSAARVGGGTKISEADANVIDTAVNELTTLVS